MLYSIHSVLYRQYLSTIANPRIAAKHRENKKENEPALVAAEPGQEADRGEEEKK